ncbi:hypothetical protein B0A48_05338 [Cryoendolithus antarcticus]|uniref:Cytochrome P450 n=1 Tax=Cryoendolithus antarcticus TaxID=1507870 RepID=A0A1V8TI64_9PEZI|nr:hypothetical protein B0A48_05338 [Cryoendolithus antarcticus]
MGLPIIPTVAACLLLAYFIYTYLIYPALLSPLSRVPNAHWSAPISPLWVLYHRLFQNDTRAVHAAHTELGPIIRLAPNELSLNCVDGGIRTIYAGGYAKGDWYSNVFSNYGVQPMFAMPEHGPHSKRKRMLSNIYAKSTLQGNEGVGRISRALLHERLLPRLEAVAASGKPTEVYDIFSSVTMDFVAAYVFGLRNGSDFLRQPEFAKKFVKDYKARQLYTFWPQEMPRFTDFMSRVGLLGLIVPKWVTRSNHDIEDWIISMCDRAELSLTGEAAEKGEIGAAEDFPTVYAQLRTALIKDISKSDLDLSVEQIAKTHRLDMASEMLDHVLAGFDTSSITLTWLAWQLSRPCNVQWQQRLQAEIDALHNVEDAKEIDTLPVLNAILMETLRLHAAIPGNQPRVTPPAATLGEPGHALSALPAGIRVQSQAWSLHRNPEVFPDPYAWNPARWLESSELQLKEMGRWFWAFGSGGRMCVGSNLAMLEMKNVMVAVWGAFLTSIADDSGMIANGGYLAEPMGKDGKFLVLQLEKRGKAQQS